MEHKVKEVK